MSNGRWRDIVDDKEKYAAYLCSREWAEKREAVRERAENKCERCHAFPMEACHHLTYARKYNESLEDLQASCNFCHEYTHGKSDFDPCDYYWFILYVQCVEKASRPVGFEFTSNDADTIHSNPANLIVLQLLDQWSMMRRNLPHGPSGELTEPVRESIRWGQQWIECALLIEREMVKAELTLWCDFGRPRCDKYEHYELILRTYGFEASPLPVEVPPAASDFGDF